MNKSKIRRVEWVAIDQEGARSGDDKLIGVVCLIENWSRGSYNTACGHIEHEMIRASLTRKLLTCEHCKEIIGHLKNGIEI